MLSDAVIEKFWSRVDKNGPVAREGLTPCWLWLGSTHKAGHGQTAVKGRKGLYYTHRLAWEIANGPVPNGMCVCHECDVPSCCNTEHLFLGTRGDNMRDMWSKARGKKAIENLAAGPIAMRARSTIGDAQIVGIFLDRIAGERTADIAVRFGVSYGTISSILRRTNWKHVPVPQELVDMVKLVGNESRRAAGRAAGSRRRAA